FRIKEFYLVNKRYWSIILLYIAAQVLSVVIPLAIFATTGIRDASMVVYVNVTVFLLAVVGSFLILKRDLQEERLSHPLPVGKIIGWTALGKIGSASCRERE